MKKRGFLKSIGGLNILLLGLVSFLNDFSSELILPLLPLFITALGGTGLIIGLIGGLMQGLPEIFKVFAGYLSDRFKHRKRFIFSGYFVSQLAKFSMIFALSPINVLFSMSSDKLGKGIREAPRDALISESLPREKGKAFGIQRTFDSAGAIVGSLVVLFMVIFLASNFTRIIFIKRIIFIAAIIGLLSLVPIFFLREGRKLDGNGRVNKGFFSSLKSLPQSLKRFIILSIIFAFANFSYMFFILKAGLFFNHNSNFIIPVIPIALYVLFNIFYTIFAIPFGKLSDKIGREKVLIMGSLIFSFVCFGFLFASNIVIFTILFALYGLVYAIMIGGQRAFVSDLTPDNLRATGLGAFQTIIGVASIFAGVLSGYLFDLNSSYLFLYGFILSLIYVFCFIFYSRTLKKK
jgi:MFS family permease